MCGLVNGLLGGLLGFEEGGFGRSRLFWGVLVWEGGGHRVDGKWSRGYFGMVWGWFGGQSGQRLTLMMVAIWEKDKGTK